MTTHDDTRAFEAERGRLTRLATQVLRDSSEAEDVVQQAWLRLHTQGSDGIENLPGWLTTVTTRLCLDRLRQRVPEPAADLEVELTVPDPADDVALADAVGVAMHVVLDRLTPTERVAFVLHDTFGYEFAAIAELLGSSPAAARKLASRARAKVRQPAAEDALADWQVVDAFLAAAREGDFAALLELLAPDVSVSADDLAAAMGTPTDLQGAEQVAGFFNGGAAAAFRVWVAGRAAAAWIHRGEAKVVFDFTIVDGRIERVTFRADVEVLGQVKR